MKPDPVIRQSTERLGFKVVDLHRVRVVCGACAWFQECASDLDAMNAAGRHWHLHHDEDRQYDEAVADAQLADQQENTP
jgi:16S rRNA U516 pseudouridylate synthase RsuA-like enzyme